MRIIPVVKEKAMIFERGGIIPGEVILMKMNAELINYFSNLCVRKKQKFSTTNQ